MTAPARDDGLLLHRLFDQQVARNPDRIAVRDPRGELTYARLAQRAGQLAALLHDRSPQPGARIGLHLERGAEVIVAMLAVLGSGHTYVPLDPAYPAERLRFTAQDAGLHLVLSDQPVPAELAALPVLRLDTLPEPGRQLPLPEPVVDPDTPAYVIHLRFDRSPQGRSDSAPQCGRPDPGLRGPLRTAPGRRVDALPLLLVRLLGMGDLGRPAQRGDAGGGAAGGGGLAPGDPGPAGTRGVTVFSVVPSVFRYLARVARTRRTAVPPALRCVVFGGESIDVRDVRAWRAAFGRTTRFVNTYGITEATVFVTSRPLTDEELDRDPDAPGGSDFAAELGEPLDGWQLRVVDQEGADIRPGGTGEILVSGAGIAPDTWAGRS
ncbi:AMP-binding protein [Streptacidiphilus sp. 4-A2]|nr:AMP-binding protein [Streptacidiphilus sp. 4-A2]